MHIMEEVKQRDLNRSERLSRSDHLKTTLTGYLQKRNYPPIQNLSLTKHEVALRNMVECEFGRPNSVLYTYDISDPVVIDLNFSKFLLWLKDLIKNKNICHDLENLVGPLFCHLYLDILRRGHNDRAATFFKVHFQAVDKTKCDDFIKELLNSFATDNGANKYKELFRSNKYSIELSPNSVKLLKKFVAECCHVVFLQVLQTWFNIQEVEEKQDESNEESMVVSIGRDQSKFQKIKSAIKELKHELKQVFTVSILNTKEPVNCGLIKSSFGIVAFSQLNALHIRPIHTYDSVGCHKMFKEIVYGEHQDKLFDIAISPKNEYVASASADKNVCLFDLVNLKLVKTCVGHLGPVYCVKFNNCGSFIASGSYDNTVRLWSTDDGKTIRVFCGHNQSVTCIDFHPNSLYIVSGSADRTVRLWSIQSGKCERLFPGAKGVILDVAIHPQGHYFASASDDKRIQIWDILRVKLLVELKYKDDLVSKLVWSKDGKNLCAGSLEGIIRIWDFGCIQENNTTENKFYEPFFSISLHSKLIGLEFVCGTFACVTAPINKK